MRTLKDNNGAAANFTTSALSIVSCNSGMRVLLAGASSFLEALKKRANLAPDFCPAGKPAPVRADQSDQLVAFVDRNEVILRGRSPSDMAHAIDEQGSHIVLHLAQDGIHLHDVSPGIQRKQRFGGPRRARIQGYHFSLR